MFWYVHVLYGALSMLFSFSFLFFFLYFFFSFFFLVEEASVVVPDDDGGREWRSKERKPVAGCLLKTTIQGVIGGGLRYRARVTNNHMCEQSIACRSFSLSFALNLGPIRSIATKAGRKVKFGARRRTRTSKLAN